MRRWHRGEERRALVTDGFATRGWEAKEVVVITSTGAENLIMRTIGFSFLIKTVHGQAQSSLIQKALVRPSSHRQPPPL